MFRSLGRCAHVFQFASEIRTDFAALRLPEPLIRKRPTGRGFQTAFEFNRFALIRKRDIRDQMPRPVFGCVGRTPTVMLRKSDPQVIS
jgi:hypothetical protein